MTRRDWFHVSVLVCSASIGVLVVAFIIGGVLGRALMYGALLALIAGVLCLALSVITPPK